jgi:hypothetical protein
MVDGGHTYDVAIADLNNAVGHIAPSGLLLVDDTNCAHPWCVVKPWQDFLAKNQHRLVPTTTLEYKGPKECRTGLSGAILNE